MPSELVFYNVEPELVSKEWLGTKRFENRVRPVAMIVGAVGVIVPVTTLRRSFCGPGAHSPAKQRHRRTYVVAPAWDSHQQDSKQGMDAMNTVRNIVLAAAGVAALVVAAPGTASADPTPPPGPYQIPGPSGPVLPGVQTYQPVCLTAPLACGLRYDPGTGTWQPGTGST